MDYYSQHQMIFADMDKDELYEIANIMCEMMGSDQILDDLLKALSSQELEDNLRYIDRMEDLNLFEEYE